MALRVTIDVFSGLPNPSVVLTGRAERALLERLGRPRLARGGARAAPATRSRLGYRGVRVETLAPDGATRAARSAAAGAVLRVVGGLVQRADGASAPLDDPSLERFLVGPDGPLRGAVADVRLLEQLADRVQREPSATRARVRARALETAADLPERCACAPLWEPAWWNDGGPIQFGNNCYNYATNVRTDTYAKPGRANGVLFASLSAADVRLAALADALAETPARNRCPGKGHLVALFVSQWDFHWYRKHRNGLWTHKPGPDPITQVDNAGQPIADPRSADRGEYVQLVGFFVVQHGHVKIA
jgi:hypothetical protein